jgi:hypothetical protein
MRGSPGICHWFRTRAAPRVVARLCLLALLLNLVAPIAWAAALPPPPPPAPVEHCHDDAAPAEPVGHVHPGHPAHHSGDSKGLTPHCPLCVLFGGTAWAPPVGSATVVVVRTAVIAAPTIGADALALAPSPKLRPSPRAPPL